MGSSIIFGTVQAFICCTPCERSGFPFSHALNMQFESMALCSESPFQPKTLFLH